MSDQYIDCIRRLGNGFPVAAIAFLRNMRARSSEGMAQVPKGRKDVAAADIQLLADDGCVV